MTDIANIRRRRLERLANNSVPVAAKPQGAPEDGAEDGGIVEEQKTQDSIIPSEFECILCLRCVSLRRRDPEWGVRVLFSRKRALFSRLMTLSHIN